MIYTNFLLKIEYTSKIEVRFDNDHGILMHANDSEWHDVWIKLPFRL